MKIELYIKHVEEMLKTLTTRKFDIESNINIGKGVNSSSENWDTHDDTLHFVITFSAGQNYGNVSLINFVLSCDCESHLVDEVYELLIAYQKKAYNKKIEIEQYNIVETLATPYVESQAFGMNVNIGSRISVTGELLVGENLIGLNKVYINNNEVDYVSVNEVFTATPNLQPNTNGLSRGLNTVATYQLSLSLVNTSSNITTLLRRVMHFKESMNTKFNIRLDYVGEEKFIENYVLVSCAINHTKANVPIYNLAFALRSELNE